MKRLLPCLLLLVFYSASADAHRVHFGWTDANWKDGTLEITHRVHEHDATLLLHQLDGKPVDITTLEAQARFAIYASKHFQIYLDGKPLAPSILGASIEGPYLLVFQELNLPNPAKLINRLSFDTDILMELFDDQVHLVNLVWPGHNQTLEFNKRTRPKGFSATVEDK